MSLETEFTEIQHSEYGICWMCDRYLITQTEDTFVYDAWLMKKDGLLAIRYSCTDFLEALNAVRQHIEDNKAMNLEIIALQS